MSWLKKVETEDAFEDRYSIAIGKLKLETFDEIKFVTGLIRLSETAKKLFSVATVMFLLFTEKLYQF